MVSWAAAACVPCAERGQQGAKRRRLEGGAAAAAAAAGASEGSDEEEDEDEDAGECIRTLLGMEWMHLVLPSAADGEAHRRFLQTTHFGRLVCMPTTRTQSDWVQASTQCLVCCVWHQAEGVTGKCK